MTESLLEQGVVNDAASFDFESASQPPPQEEVRSVTIKVPVEIPDNVVHSAWQVGMGTIQRLQMGLLVIAFPSVGRAPDGRVVNTIGKFEMLVSKAEDVKRILGLAQVIHNENMKIANAGATDLLGVTIDATKTKDEVVRQLTQEAKGEVPLIVPRKA